MPILLKIVFPIVLGALINYTPCSGGSPSRALNTQSATVSTFAGVAVGTSNTPPMFQGPTSVAVDGSGNVYVADTGNHVICMLTQDGVVTTLAGTAGQQGSVDGPGQSALFNGPNGIAVDALGNIFVADSGNSTIRKITSGGMVSTLAGTPGQLGSADGTGPAARFWWPFGVAVDGSGTVYVADTSNDSIRKITAGGVVSTLAITADMAGYANGPGTAAIFSRPNSLFSPHSIVIDSSGNLYVADSGNEIIRKITPNGLVSMVVGTGVRGCDDGPGSFATFYHPTSLALDGAGNLYVADPLNEVIRKITPADYVITIAGMPSQLGSTDGPVLAATFFHPSGVAVDGSGNIYVADTLNGTIRKITF
ncbi:MAG: NHL repeat-containing protein [Holophaga sp.]